MTGGVPGFDEWVAYCFEHGYADWCNYSDDPDDVIEAREARFTWSMPAMTVAEYLIRLFESPGFVADRYSDDQIGAGVRFLFSASEYMKTVRSWNVFKGWTGEVDAATGARCYRALATLYCDLFDRVCCRRGTDPDTDYRQTESLDGAVYMIWDMSTVEGALYFPEKGPHLVEPGFASLEEVVMHCRTSTCLISALHGLGHIYLHQPTRVTPIIDRFLTRGGVPEWVRDYAREARRGAVL